jgi:hypothetical protein
LFLALLPEDPLPKLAEKSKNRGKAGLMPGFQNIRLLLVLFPIQKPIAF